MSKDILSQDEVDALLNGVTGQTDEAPPPEDTSGVRPYNLATQERIVRSTVNMVPAFLAVQTRYQKYQDFVAGRRTGSGKQLADIWKEFLNDRHMYRLDRLTNTLSVTPLVTYTSVDEATYFKASVGLRFRF